ncbi:hypothetical protein ACNKHO_10325 [Shigella flexneri]
MDTTPAAMDATSGVTGSGYNVPAILVALGGAENIVLPLESASPGRLSVHDMSKVDEAVLKPIAPSAW